MKSTPVLSLAAVLFLAPLAATAADAIPAEDAVRFVGKEGMVCGKVEKTRYAQNSEGEPTFLYMGGAFPRHTFSARIPSSARGSFSFDLLTLDGKTVCAIGKIARDASRAEIVVTSPSNLKLANIK